MVRTNADRVVAQLLDALDIILRETEKENASRHYINGAASMAVALANACRERNADGYLVVKE